eukprot:TRINITY_DN16074_c0_g1_i26.p1 TRINITY_DN16074_c0_g1~~TRINITY_DN16074_c0_g1_i26.p1  ORF type:complete len:214 (+),score=74.73 TRINITY_DN16074_c0_g1_i26:46-642(+)
MLRSLVGSEMCIRDSLGVVTVLVIEVENSQQEHDILTGGRGLKWNILDAMEAAIHSASAAVGEEKLILQHAALRTARKYIMLLLTVLYLDDQNGYNPQMPLRLWCQSLNEIKNVLERFEDRPDLTLKLLAAGNIMEGHSRDGRTAARRTGDVLTANYCIKADHFPGCQKKELRPVICGGPNFRKVDMINVYGLSLIHI